jgi:wobble nucleotide-excising tRNase
LSEKKELWELKQTAKWSHNLREKKMAIKELSFHGEYAIQYLDEVMSVTTYDEIKAACIEAIKEIREKKNMTKNHQQSPPPQQETAVAEFDPTVTKLADLPP